MKKLFLVIIGITLLFAAAMAQDAAYSPTYTAPHCAYILAPCVANSSLLMSRDDWSPPEPNQPNTIDSCTDGTSGSYGTDENVQNITLASSSGYFHPGDNITVGAWIHCHKAVDGSTSNINLAYAIDAKNPSWTYLSQQSCSDTQWEYHNFSMTLNSSFAGKSAVRVLVGASLNTGVTCDTGSDNDDVVLAVANDTNSTPPSITITAPGNGGWYVSGEHILLKSNASDNEMLSDISWYYNDTLIHTCSADSPAATCNYLWDTTGIDYGRYTITAIATDYAKSSTTTNRSINIDSTAGVIQHTRPAFKVDSSGGTEYETGEYANLWVLITNNTDGSPITSATCKVDVYDGAGTAVVSGASMTPVGSTGMYRYRNSSLTGNEGYYTGFFNCSYNGNNGYASHSFHVAPWANTIEDGTSYLKEIQNLLQCDTTVDESIVPDGHSTSYTSWSFGERWDNASHYNGTNILWLYSDPTRPGEYINTLQWYVTHTCSNVSGGSNLRVCASYNGNSTGTLVGKTDVYVYSVDSISQDSVGVSVYLDDFLPGGSRTANGTLLKAFNDINVTASTWNTLDINEQLPPGKILGVVMCIDDYNNGSCYHNATNDLVDGFVIRADNNEVPRFGGHWKLFEDADGSANANAGKISNDFDFPQVTYTSDMDSSVCRYLDDINSTSSGIYTLATEINSTTWNTNDYLKNTIYPAVDDLENDTADILSNQTNIYNKLVEIQDNVTTTYTEVLVVEALTNDTYHDMGSNFTDIRNRLIEINTTTQNTLANITSVVEPKLDHIIANTTTIYDAVDNLNNEFNCTQMNPSDVCYRLNMIQGYTDNVENYVVSVNDTLNNYQTIDVDRFDSIDGNLSAIYNDTQYIRTNMATNNSTSTALDSILNLTTDINQTSYSIQTYLTGMNTTLLSIYNETAGSLLTYVTTGRPWWFGGDTMVVRSQFHKVNGQLIDPDTITIQILDDADAVLSSGNMTRDSTGEYYYKYLIQKHTTGMLHVRVYANLGITNTSKTIYVRVFDENHAFGTYCATSIGGSEGHLSDDGYWESGVAAATPEPEKKLSVGTGLMTTTAKHDVTVAGTVLFGLLSVGTLYLFMKK